MSFWSSWLYDVQLYEGSFQHLKRFCVVRPLLRWNAFTCEFIGVCSPILLPASLSLVLLTVPFIGFWPVAEGICFGLFLTDLWESADIQESAAKNLLLISKLMCFMAEPLALSSSFLTTSLIYGETNIGSILWDYAVLFLGVTFGISLQEGK